MSSRDTYNYAIYDAIDALVKNSTSHPVDTLRSLLRKDNGETLRQIRAFKRGCEAYKSTGMSTLADLYDLCPFDSLSMESDFWRSGVEFAFRSARGDYDGEET